MMLDRTKRAAVLVACGALSSLAPLSASALSDSISNVSSTGGNPAVLRNDDIVTYDLVRENNTNLNIFGVGIDFAGLAARRRS